jgi:hypothetical protein
MSELDNNRRKHDALRVMVDNACSGVLEPVANRIKRVARRAYFLGCKDGMEIAQERMREPRKLWIYGNEYDLSKGEDVKAIGEVISNCQERAAPNDLALIASTLLSAALEVRYESSNDRLDALTG